MVRNQTIRNLLELPIELIELIMSYISYDEIAKIRSVCRTFDSCSQRLLNRGFIKVEKYHAICFKRVKSQLPRRESERRSHPLARHCDVLSAIETRLSLLGMTYMKYVDMSLCCFIPGKVIDEIYRVLRFIQNNPNPPRVHELLQELRDISSMAMEYFEEKIAPSLKSKLSGSSNAMTAVGPLSSTSITSCRSLPSTSNTNQIYSNSKQGSYPDPELLNSNINLVKQMQHSQNTIKKELNDMKVRFKDFSSLKREITNLKNKNREHEKNSIEKEQIIAELKSQLEDLKRRMSEYDKKSALKPIKDEMQVQKETKSSKRKTIGIQSKKSVAKRISVSSKSIIESEINYLSFELKTTEPENVVNTTRKSRTSKRKLDKIEKPIINRKSKTVALNNEPKLDSIEIIDKTKTKRKRKNKSSHASTNKRKRIS